MKIRLLLTILLACCALCAVSASAALTVQPATGVPTGDLAPGTRLTIDTTIIEFIPGTASTFPTGDSLQFYTDLDSPKWSISIVQNGVENARPISTSRIVSITGFELSYPSDMDIKVRVNLEGVVPEVTTTSDKTIFRIRQLDLNDGVRSGTSGEYLITRKVVNPAEVQTAIVSAKGSLQVFKTEIDAAKADGVDTTAVDAKYNSAQTALQSAEAAGSNVGVAQSYLNTAQTAITDGEALLQRAIVQHAITSADATLAEIDGVLSYFTTNKSMGSDSRVVLLSSKRQSVKNQIDTAKGNFDTNNLALAKRQADDALAEGKIVLAEARELQEEVESLPVFVDPGQPFLWIVLGAIAIIVIGFVIMKKRNAWDELG
ncbi:hypothetical protein [Methanocalculus sp.]|uniref:hypothetical protein n=1 Tax=Methanocalculus sp. TaxID=2004547 RepID=UPI002610AF5D|nr:hypothetical protein [Methanocalculus sp.]MDG6250262.1 hypothetical protein [Methanocalculus sp.]